MNVELPKQGDVVTIESMSEDIKTHKYNGQYEVTETKDNGGIVSCAVVGEGGKMATFYYSESGKVSSEEIERIEGPSVFDLEGEAELSIVNGILTMTMITTPPSDKTAAKGGKN